MRRNVTSNVVIFNAASLATTLTSVVCNCEQLDTILLSGIWSGTTCSSTLNTWVSNDNVNWFSLGASFQTSVNATSGSYMMKITDAVYKYVKLIQTFGTGAGTHTAWFKGTTKGA